MVFAGKAGIIASGTKADFIRDKLDIEALKVVSDLLLVEERAPDVYERDKEKLIGTYSVSIEANLRRIIKGGVSTTGKPSLIITRLKALGTGVSDGIIHTIFLDHLPA